MQENKEIWMVQTKRADFNGLAMRLGVSPVAVRVMRNRGLVDEEEMRRYLYGTLDDLYDPRLMKGMEQAAELIERKLKEGKHVRIIGDYDIDGVCSTYILLKGFKRTAEKLAQDCLTVPGQGNVWTGNTEENSTELGKGRMKSQWTNMGRSCRLRILWWTRNRRGRRIRSMRSAVLLWRGNSLRYSMGKLESRKGNGWSFLNLQLLQQWAM